MYFLRIIDNRFQTFNLPYVKYCAENNNEGTKALNYEGCKQWWIEGCKQWWIVPYFIYNGVKSQWQDTFFNKTMRDIVERTYKCLFHL